MLDSKIIDELCTKKYKINLDRSSEKTVNLLYLMFVISKYSIISKDFNSINELALHLEKQFNKKISLDDIKNIKEVIDKQVLNFKTKLQLQKFLITTFINVSKNFKSFPVSEKLGILQILIDIKSSNFFITNYINGVFSKEEINKILNIEKDIDQSFISSSRQSNKNEDLNEREKLFLKRSVVVTTILFLFIQEKLFGLHDWLTLLMVSISSLLMFFTIHTLHISSREIARNHTVENSVLYKFLSGDSKSTYVTAIIMSVISSFIMITVIKGMAQTYESSFILLLLLFIGSIIIFSVIQERNVESNFVKTTFSPEISNHFATFAYLVLISIIFNFLITIMLTTYDVREFIQNTVDINNFESVVIEHKIEKNGYNEISRALIHIYMLMDQLKHAVTNLIFDEVFEANKSDYWLSSYFIIFFFNFVKMIGFSFGFVFIHKGVQTIGRDILAKNKTRQWLKI